MAMEMQHNQTENLINHGSDISELKYAVNIQLKNETYFAENRLFAKIWFCSK